MKYVSYYQKVDGVLTGLRIARRVMMIILSVLTLITLIILSIFLSWKIVGMVAIVMLTSDLIILNRIQAQFDRLMNTSVEVDDTGIRDLTNGDDKFIQWAEIETVKRNSKGVNSDLNKNRITIIGNGKKIIINPQLAPEHLTQEEIEQIESISQTVTIGSSDDSVDSEENSDESSGFHTEKTISIDGGAKKITITKTSKSADDDDDDESEKKGVLFEKTVTIDGGSNKITVKKTSKPSKDDSDDKTTEPGQSKTTSRSYSTSRTVTVNGGRIKVVENGKSKSYAADRWNLIDMIKQHRPDLTIN